MRVQIPALRIVTVLSSAVQTGVVVESKVTTLPDVPPVALRVKGETPRVTVAGAQSQ